MINPQKIAFYWESESEARSYTFGQIEKLTNQIANFFVSKGVKKGDRVFFFLPRIPELYAGILATQKMGAVGGAFFAAFGSQALLDRLKNSEAKVLITNQELCRRVEPIRSQLPELKEIILIDKKFARQVENFPPVFKKAVVNPDEAGLMLYTSATGNTPVCGIVLPRRALNWQLKSAQLVLDLKDNDIYWCTADPGWVTGLIYGLLVPWHLGITQVIYTGRFTADKWVALIEKYRVSLLYTAPTALRMLQKEEASFKKIGLSSLRHVASVGEALTPASFKWFKNKFGLEVHDTWWQTETGSIMIANYPGIKVKAGSMGKPLPWIKAAIVNEKGQKLPNNQTGFLVLRPPLESALIDIWHRSENLKEYFHDNWYYSGDLAHQDKEGYFWFVGRANDVIKTSGERVGAFEVETVLDNHPAVLEAAVIGKPDELRGEIIKAFVVLKKNFKASTALTEKLQFFTKKYLAGHAYPREIEYIEALPKNRAGKIVRRLLKAKELGLPPG
ncbi:MAG: AMP-binding protein [Candidatus Shapirobacteria bacterium]